MSWRRPRDGTLGARLAMRLSTLLLVLICGCAQAPHAMREPEGVLALRGVTIIAPTDPAWELIEADDTEATFQKSGDHASLVVRVILTDSFPDEQAFLRSAEARQEAAVSKLEMVSGHYNYAGLNDATCLQYDGIFRDPTAAGSESEFLNVRGYVCRPPKTAARAVQMEFTQHSASKFPPDFERTLNLIEAVFRSAVFTNAAPE